MHWNTPAEYSEGQVSEPRMCATYCKLYSKTYPPTSDDSIVIKSLRRSLRRASRQYMQALRIVYIASNCICMYGAFNRLPLLIVGYHDHVKLGTSHRHAVPCAAKVAAPRSYQIWYCRYPPKLEQTFKLISQHREHIVNGLHRIPPCRFAILSSDTCIVIGQLSRHFRDSMRDGKG